jgi:hypothetical protein
MNTQTIMGACGGKDQASDPCGLFKKFKLKKEGNTSDINTKDI